MSQRIAFAALFFGALAGQLHAQSATTAHWDSASYAWDAGNYPDALRRLDRLLRGPGGDTYLKRVALLTGEFYRTTEVSADGRNLRWSGDGRFASYEIGSGAATMTHIVAIEPGGPRKIAEIPGTGVAFAPDGSRVAHFGRAPVAAAPAQQAAGARGQAADQGQRAQGGGQRGGGGGGGGGRGGGRGGSLSPETPIVIRDLQTGASTAVNAPHLARGTLLFHPDGRSLYMTGEAVAGSPLATAGEAAVMQIWQLTLGGSAAPTAITRGPGAKTNPRIIGRSHILFTSGNNSFGIVDISSGVTRTINGSAPAVSADGSTIAFLSRDSMNTLNVVRVSGGDPVVIKRSALPLASPAVSRDGSRIAFQMMPREDQELYVIGADGQNEVRLTHEIQHDLQPQFLADANLLGTMGENRHRRSYLYDVNTRERVRLHHNNTVRTVAPEYEWVASPDGTKLLIVADRDGDTISPERAVVLMDLTRTVTADDVLRRIAASLDAETKLRAFGERAFAPIRPVVTEVVADVSTARISRAAHDVYAFDSKHITQPGNAKAIEYYAARLREYGYEPELQWFEPRPGIRTANIIAKLPGTVNPELIYAVSSHFDSVERGPGADDDSSGATALLEAARVLARRPQACTIHFAFFTGEEAGLLGSTHYVRTAVERGDRLVGALNNDMIGFMNDHHYDNTIRYSNVGIRDIQHAAAFLFTNLITYDAKYYQSTDAAAYFREYGDIVGGIGSYPILGNPHYHQSHDVLETISQQLVAEVSKTTVATLMMLANSPSRLTGLEVTHGATTEARWTASPETGIQEYIVAWGPAQDPLREQLRAREPRVAFRTRLAPGSMVSVKAVNTRGLESWDWARVTVR